MAIRQSSLQLQALPRLCILSDGSGLHPQEFSLLGNKDRRRRFNSVRCQSSTSTVVTGDRSAKRGNESLKSERNVIRLGLPSKGRMAADTLDLLKDCQLGVHQVNARQYVANIPGLPNVEVWFQRAKDVVRKLVTGDLDLGIVGYDTVCEFGEDNDDLILVHDALGYGECHLAIAIPKYGIFENVSSLDELTAMPQWTAERPLRIATGFSYLGAKFVKEKGLKHVEFSMADGALEAAPAMGIADAILDLVGSGTTLHENNLKEIEGGTILESQGVFVASKKALVQRKDALEAAHEMLERLEAHLRANSQFTVVANMRGNSAEEVAGRVLKQADLSGLQGPTVSPVFCKTNGEITVDYYAIVICVPKNCLYDSICRLRAMPALLNIFCKLTKWVQTLTFLKHPQPYKLHRFYQSRKHNPPRNQSVETGILLGVVNCKAATLPWGACV